MRMSVSPKEIAEYLVNEFGHQKAIEECHYHLNRCVDAETAGVWHNIGAALNGMRPIQRCN